MDTQHPNPDDNRPNRTREDAFKRVKDARLGYLKNASPEYLLALRGHVARWLHDLNGAIAGGGHET